MSASPIYFPLVNWFLILVDGSKILKEPAVFIDKKKVGFKELEEFLMTEPDSNNKSSLMTQFEYVHIKYFTLHMHIYMYLVLQQNHSTVGHSSNILKQFHRLKSIIQTPYFYTREKNSDYMIKHS